MSSHPLCALTVGPHETRTGRSSSDGTPPGESRLIAFFRAFVDLEACRCEIPGKSREFLQKWPKILKSTYKEKTLVHSISSTVHNTTLLNSRVSSTRRCTLLHWFLKAESMAAPHFDDEDTYKHRQSEWSTVYSVPCCIACMTVD